MYVRVAFPLALPDALTYVVPEQLAPLAVAGARVRARLRGTPRVGLIVGTEEQPPAVSGRMVAIDEVLDAEPLLPAHVLELVRFAADYYLAPVGMVVRGAVPSQLLRIPPPLVLAGQRARELAGVVQGDARRLLERVMEAGRITVARLRAEGWPADQLPLLLESLASRHAIKVVERRPPSQAGGTVTALALVELEPAERRARIGRAPGQLRAIAWLEETGRPVLEGELLAACRCSASVVTELVRKGLARRFQQTKHLPRRRWELAPPPPPAILTTYQREALTRVEEAVAGEEFQAFLLLGVTGSGKTEVYLRLAAAVAARRRQTIVLVPEIGLTPALAGLLAARFGDRVAVLHSSMAEGERFSAWERARRGEVDVVAGPRSALWAPLPAPGLVVVDEEQDASYKQEEEPRYNARDLALVLGQRLGVPVVLASATPSLDMLHLARQERIEVLELPERVAGGRLPTVEVIDLRGEEPEPGEHGHRFFSRRLKELLGGVEARGEQAILLVNRRGWAPVMLCRECGHQASCGACSIPMTVHRRRGSLLCHYCGFAAAIPSRCPRCNGEVLEDVGAGTEKIATRVRELHPGLCVDVLDRDTARSPAQLLATLERFGAGESDVLVGTQMVSKGHHFPQVTLTAVINADNLLGFPDFRGAERTFQMLTQVAGRAGRGERPGSVVIQTYHPEHHAIQAAVAHDPRGFAAEEERFRRAFRYPPWSRLALVRFESEREASAVAAAETLARALAPPVAGLRVVGPAPAPIARLRGAWRVQLLLSSPSRSPLREALAVVAACPLPAGVRRIIDVDPQTTA